MPIDLRLLDLGRNREIASFSSRPHAVFICSVPNTGTRLVALSTLEAMYGRQYRDKPGNGINDRNTKLMCGDSVQ